MSNIPIEMLNDGNGHPVVGAIFGAEFVAILMVVVVGVQIAYDELQILIRKFLHFWRAR